MRTSNVVHDASAVILVVEDSMADRLLLEREIDRRFPDLRVEYTDSIAAARAICDANEVTVAVVDHLLTDGSGLELVDAYPTVPWIVVTGTGSERIAAAALRKGAVDYVIKEGGHLEQVGRAIEAELAHSSTHRVGPHAVAPESGSGPTGSPRSRTGSGSMAVNDAHRAAAIDLERVCGWCRSRLGADRPRTARRTAVSHGLCGSCAEQLMRKAALRMRAELLEQECGEPLRGVLGDPVVDALEHLEPVVA